MLDPQDPDTLTAIRFLRSQRLPETEANTRIVTLALSLSTGPEREQTALLACAGFFRRLSELGRRGESRR